MKDLSLLNELEQKVRQLISSLQKEREKNVASNNVSKESQKLSKIEAKISNVVKLIEQLENS